MAAAKKKKKKARKGRKGGKARASTAKRGAAKRHTLKVGTVVTKKPNKKTLAKHKLKATPVGIYNGKKAYKIQRKKKAKPTAKSGYAAAMRARTASLKSEADKKKAEARALAAKWRAVIALRKKAEKLGLAAEMDKQAAIASQYEADLQRKNAERAAAEKALADAREESRGARQSYED